MNQVNKSRRRAENRCTGTNRPSNSLRRSTESPNLKKAQPTKASEASKSRTSEAPKLRSSQSSKAPKLQNSKAPKCKNVKMKNVIQGTTERPNNPTTKQTKTPPTNERRRNTQQSLAYGLQIRLQHRQSSITHTAKTHDTRQTDSQTHPPSILYLSTNSILRFPTITKPQKHCNVICRYHHMHPPRHPTHTDDNVVQDSHDP